ncbi:hypothetical protein DFH28DRAFT_932075 [Melampsora americana]|nr:hypothetical protein DFH28DRAFT_940400 [Melampsora americana]KAH9811318.1 hypothetical protein DFH28DRAFT_932075 [Melampsora americana]
MSIFRTDQLENATVLVTGASGGIGEATAILFARAGSNVIITARREVKLQEVKLLAEKANQEGNTGKGGKVIALPLDMQDKQAIDGFLDKVPKEFQKIDILVNNAGLVYGRDSVGELNFDEVEVMISILTVITLFFQIYASDIEDTNVLGLFRLTNLLVKGMKERGRGHIINLGSVAGREAYAGGSIYCATKHAVNAFSGALMRELVSTPLRVSEIQPGMVETEFSVTRFRGDRKAADQVYEGLKPLTAQDIAEEIVWCASRPAHVNIAELFVLPTAQASAGIHHKMTK